MVGGYREELVPREGRCASRRDRVFQAPGEPWAWAIFLAAVLGLASCATSPQAAPPAAEGEFARLDPGAMIYLSADIPRIRPILEEVAIPGITPENAAMIMDFTDEAVAAAYPAAPEGDEAPPRHYLLFARGNYPKGRIDFSFTWSRYWKRAVSGRRKYWRSVNPRGKGAPPQNRAISLAVERDWALLSDGDPFAETSGVEAPPAYAALKTGAASAGWIPQGGTILNNLLVSMELPLRIPAELILFALYPLEEEKYQAVFRLETENPTIARGLVSMLNLARTFTSGTMPELEGTSSLLMNILLSNPPEQEGASLTLKTNPLDAGAIALLFSQLLVNSNDRGVSEAEVLEEAR